MAECPLGWITVHGWREPRDMESTAADTMLFQATHISGIYPHKGLGYASSPHARLLCACGEIYIRESVDEVRQALIGSQGIRLRDYVRHGWVVGKEANNG